MPPPAKVPRKKKVGRPAFKRKDIPETFFRYYDAYKYGFWTKQHFAWYIGVSRPTLDRYLKFINAKKPFMSNAENKKFRKQHNIETIADIIDFVDFLKAYEKATLLKEKEDRKKEKASIKNPE